MDRPSESPPLRIAPILVGVVAALAIVFVSDGRTHARTRREHVAPRIELRVRVVHGEAASPVPGARVVLESTEQASTTDRNGLANLPLPGGEGMLLVTAPGFARFRGLVDPRAVPAGAAVRVVLEPGIALPCHVENELRAPIDQATLRAVPDDAVDEPPIVARVDASGNGVLDFLSPGRWLVTASAPSHASSSRVVVLGPSGPATETFTLVRAGTIDARVVDEAGAPVEGATVYLGGVSLRPAREGRTDERGVARFDELPPGPYDARAVGRDRASRRVAGIVAGPATVTTALLTLAPAQILGGRFVDASGAPIADVEVSLTEDALDMVPRSTTSGPDGSFILSPVPGVPHVLVARIEGYLPFGPVIVAPGQSLPTITLLRAGTIRGRIVDANDEPVSGVVVTLLGEHGIVGATTSAATPAPGAAPNLPLAPAPQASAPTFQAAGELGVTLGDIPPIPVGTIASTPMAASLAPTVASTTLGAVTDTNGTFVLVGVPPGVVQLVATHPLHPTVTSGSRRIASGETIDPWNLVFPPAGTVEAHVVDSRGRPLEGIPVELRTDADDVPRTSITDYEGRARFEGVVGVAILTAMPSGRAGARARADVAAGRTVRVELRLEEALHRLEGRVVDERRAPVENARVEISSSNPRSPLATFVTTEADGTFRFDGLPPPPYRLVVDHPAYAVNRRDDVRPPREGRLEIVLAAGGTITGTVVDEDGERPIERVIVSLREGDRLVDEDATDADGRYSFERIAPARYRIEAQHRDYLPADRTATLAPGRYEAPRLEVEPIELIAGFTVRGTVVDSLSDPVPRARISFPFTLGSPIVVSGPNGEFEIRGLQPGTHEVVAEHVRAGTARARRPIRGEAHDAIDGVEIRLPGRVDVDERTADRDLVRGISVLLGVSGTNLVAAWVAPGGSAEAAGLRVGDRIVSIDDEPLVEILRAEELLRGPLDVPAEIVFSRAGAARRARIARELYRPPPEELFPRR